MRIFTPEDLAKLQRQNDDAIDRMTKGLDKEAHFLALRDPQLHRISQGAYLQLSIATRLNAPAGTVSL